MIGANRRRWRKLSGISMQRLLIQLGKAHKLLDDARLEPDSERALKKEQLVRKAYEWALDSFRNFDASAEERVTFLVETEMLRRRLDEHPDSREAS